MPVHDILVIDRNAGVVLFRRNYGSLINSQVNATAGILNMIMPLVEEIGKTSSGYFSVGKDFISFYNAGDFLFVMYAEKELDPALAEKVNEELARVFEKRFGERPHSISPEVSREFQHEVDRIVLGTIGLGEFARLDLAKVSGVTFVGFYDEKENRWHTSGSMPQKTLIKFCEDLKEKFGEKVRSMASSGAIMKIRSVQSPVIIAPIGSEGIVFLGIKEEGVDIQSVIKKIERLRSLGELRSMTDALSYIPSSIEPEYRSLLRIYSYIYSEPEKSLQRDVDALRKQGYTLEMALRKLRQAIKELI